MAKDKLQDYAGDDIPHLRAKPRPSGGEGQDYWNESEHRCLRDRSNYLGPLAVSVPGATLTEIVGTNLPVLAHSEINQRCVGDKMQ